MSVTRRIAFGAAASLFSRGVTIVLALAWMPVSFHRLGKEELGVWLLLAQSSALIFILDLGLSATLTRRIALAKGRSDSATNLLSANESRQQIADLFATGQRLYHFFAIGTFVVASSTGFFYLQHLRLVQLSPAAVWLSWGVLCLGQAFGLWAQVWNCLLNGVGYVGWDAVLGSLISALTLLAQIVALFLGWGLVGLAVVAAVGLFIQRFILLGFARRRVPELFEMTGRFDAALARGMVSPSLRAWGTGLGSLLVLSTDAFFIASLAGANQIPAYRAAYLVFINLNMLAVTAGGASAVFISHLWEGGKFVEIHRVVVRNLRLGLGLMASGGACILVLGPRLFDVWLGPGNFIGQPILAIFFVLLFLETQSYIVTLASRATEDEAFAFWSLGAAAIKLALAIILGARFGLLGIAASTLLAQLATNHWYMVFRGLSRLRLTLESHLVHVLMPVAGLFCLVMLGARMVLVGNLFIAEWSQVLAASSVAAALLTGFVWLFVLEPGHRERVLLWRQLARS